MDNNNIILDDGLTEPNAKCTFLFKTYLAATIAEDDAYFLRKSGIVCEVHYELSHFGAIYDGDKTTDFFQILLAEESNIDRAHDVLQQISAEDIAALPKDYYLFSFTTK